MILETQLLSKNFLDGGKKIKVLQNISFSMPAESSLSIMGQSGSGKTTFMNILAGMEAPSSGDIFWEGKLVQSFSEKEISHWRGKLFGLIFQSFHLLSELNVLENVMLAGRIAGHGPRELRPLAENLLERVGLADRMNYTPLKLSGGERQRVAIARSLLNKPKIILADEPTGNLDEKTAHKIVDLLFEICTESKTSLLFITHNPNFGKLTDQQLTMTNGELL